jgi:hypothetical protein
VVWGQTRRRSPGLIQILYIMVSPFGKAGRTLTLGLTFSTNRIASDYVFNQVSGGSHRLAAPRTGNEIVVEQNIGATNVKLS